MNADPIVSPSLQHWIAVAEERLPGMVELRRAIHAEPELGLHNPRTTARIKAALAGLPLEFAEGPSTSGLVATLRGAKPGRTVLLRGDMDALPMHEATGLEYASAFANIMHACGHDTHVAMLVAAAQALCAQRDRLAGNVQFMFQPGEEGWHGARHMLDDGLIDPRPDAAFALHITPNLPAGVFAGLAGPLFAAADRIELTIRGKGGHASQPHNAVDPIPVACEMVLALQSMITRRVPAFDPAVLTIAHIQTGSTNNVIPESAFIEGTIRTFSEATRAIVREGMKRVVGHVCAAHLCEADLQLIPGYPVTRCDERAVALARRTTQALFGAEAWMEMPAPFMGAEDFSYVLQQSPGAMMFLGAPPAGADWQTCWALHSNRMMLDEKVMARGAALHCALAEAFLAGGFVGQAES